MGKGSSFLLGLQKLTRSLAGLCMFLVSIAFSDTVLAASCSLPNCQYCGPNIGFQYVAQTCLGTGRSIYNRYDLNCTQSSLVEGINESLGTTPRTADEMQTWIINYYNWMVENQYLPASFRNSLKMFRNSTGSSFVLVVDSYSKYHQSIDNKDMGSSSYLYWPTFNPVDFGIFDYPSGQTPPCCLQISSFTGSPEKIKPKVGETATFSGSITSNYPITWTLSIAGRTINGSGGGVSYTWDGKNAAGEPAAAGVHVAALNVTSGGCTAGAIAFVTVIDPPDTCKMQAPYESSVDVASGNINFSQDLFAVKGAMQPISLSLTYNSLDSSAGSLGLNWRHNYDITLESSGNGAKVLHDGGSRRLYTWSGAAYASQTGDNTTLVTSGDGHDLLYPDGRLFHFAADGKIASITDRFGNTLSFDYPDGDLETITDTAYRTVTLFYDTTVIPHRLSYILDPAHNRYDFQYQGDRLWKVMNPVTDTGVAAGFWEYIYYPDAPLAGLMRSKKDPNGNTTQYDYFTDRRAKSALDPNLKTRSMVYPTTTENLRISTFTEKDTGQWLYTYDVQNGVLKEKKDPNQKATNFYHYADSNLKAKTEPFDGATRLTTFYRYDSHGNMTAETDPLDLSLPQYAGINPETVDTATFGTGGSPISWAMTYQYDLANNDRITAVSDLRSAPPLNTAYAYTTENGGEVVTVTAPGNIVTVTKYYPDGSIKETIDANQKTTTYLYYPDTPENRTAGIVGLLWKVTGPDGVVTSYGDYDKNGNPREIKAICTDEREIRTSQSFDAMSRLRTVTRFAQGLPDNLTRFGYDLNGNRTSVIDPETRETKYEYNYHGQVTKVIDARQKETVYSYGGTGCPACGGGADKLTGVTDANQHTTSFAYDTLGRLERETDPLTPNRVIRFTYYDNGLVKEKYDATGGDPGILQVTYIYNNRGQLTEKQYPGNTKAKFTYRPDGRLETASNMTGETVDFGYTYEYFDDSGRLKSVTDSNGRKLGYDEYDGIGQRKKVTILKGGGTDERVINYDYDAANRPWHIRIDGDTQTFTFDYDEQGRRDTLGYPNGTTADWDYDDLNRLTAVSHRQTGGADFAVYGYPLRDQAGNVKTKSGTTNETYVYDEIYRLRQAVTARGTEKFTYDDVGNRQTGPGPKDTAYQHNEANQMTHGRKLGYGYDNAGNQTSRTLAHDAGKGWTLTWDYENRLTKMEKTKGTEKRTISFKYDPFGKRIEKKVETIKAGVTKTATWVYVYDNEDIAFEIYTPPGGPAEKTFYTHGPGIDEPLALERGGSFYYYHTDGIGSIGKITDSGRNVVQSYTYESFGTPRAQTSFRNSYQFTAREWDKETGLYYYRARYYDPMEGRFVSRDPIGFAGGDVNLYGYVQNNSINLIDPTGESAEACVRRFAFGPIAYIFPPRHCYVMFNGNYNDTLSYDGAVGDDASPRTWFKRCHKVEPKEGCKKECTDSKIRQAMMKCASQSYAFFSHNCCDCVRGALSESGCKVPLGITITNLGF